MDGAVASVDGRMITRRTRERSGVWGMLRSDVMGERAEAPGGLRGSEDQGGAGKRTGGGVIGGGRRGRDDMR